MTTSIIINSISNGNERAKRSQRSTKLWYQSILWKHTSSREYIIIQSNVIITEVLTSTLQIQRDQRLIYESDIESSQTSALRWWHDHHRCEFGEWLHTNDRLTITNGEAVIRTTILRCNQLELFDCIANLFKSEWIQRERIVTICKDQECIAFK